MLKVVIGGNELWFTEQHDFVSAHSCKLNPKSIEEILNLNLNGNMS